MTTAATTTSTTEQIEAVRAALAAAVDEAYRTWDKAWFYIETEDEREVARLHLQATLAAKEAYLKAMGL